VLFKNPHRVAPLNVGSLLLNAKDSLRRPLKNGNGNHQIEPQQPASHSYSHSQTHFYT
jgi:hypothetical protein